MMMMPEKSNGKINIKIYIKIFLEKKIWYKALFSM